MLSCVWSYCGAWDAEGAVVVKLVAFSDGVDDTLQYQASLMLSVLNSLTGSIQVYILKEKDLGDLGKLTKCQLDRGRLRVIS